MKNLGENLTAVDQPLTEGELISQILRELGFEYDAVVVNVIGKQCEISLNEVQFQLMSYECIIAKYSATTSLDISNDFAQYAFNGNYRGNNNNNKRGCYRGSSRGRNGGRPGSKFMSTMWKRWTCAFMLQTF
ncbi:hypothetical protein Ddye_024121 [Dipteronia dyeriana]|uniref:Uncharacterized protein n=1 Tax=Dipteronia dyeriana TaxID=168575 RepID=A0AAD9TUT9_9ROSI|nr:hypothetical protein Ddye_024121 [Dipteronia dyeriana]